MADAYPAFPTQLVDPRVDEYVRQFMAARPAPTAAPAAAPAPPPANGIFTDIGHGLVQGAMVGLPTMAGQTLKAFSPVGSDVYQTGQGLVDSAKARENLPQYQTTGAWGAGAASAASALPVMALGATTLLGAPVAAAAGAAGLGAAVLFGGSAYQDTYEKAIQAGATPEAAHTAGLQAGAVQGVGQGAVAAAGGKLLSGAAGMYAKRLGAQGVLDSFANPSGVLPTMAKNIASMAAINLPVQGAAAAAMAAIDKSVGVDSGTPWEAARASFAPTAAMTALLAPLGILGAKAAKSSKEYMAKTVSEAPDADMPQEQKDAFADNRLKAAAYLRKEMATASPEDAQSWFDNASDAIQNHEPVSLNVDFDAKAAREQAAQPPQPEQPQSGQLPLPGIPPGGPDFALTPPPEQPVEPETGRQGELDLPHPDQGSLDFNANRPGGIDFDKAKQGELPVTEEQRPGFELTQPEGNVPPRVPPPPPAAPLTKQGELALGQPRPGFELQSPEGKVGPTLLEQQITALRAPKPVLDVLRSTSSDQFLDVLKKMYTQLGGDAKATKYMDNIRELFKKFTGKEISDESTPDDKSGEATAENAAGAESGSTAVQAAPEAARSAEQVGEAKGNGGPPSQDRRDAQASAGAKLDVRDKTLVEQQAILKELTDQGISARKSYGNDGQIEFSTPADSAKAAAYLADKKEISDKVAAALTGRASDAQIAANKFSGDENALGQVGKQNVGGSQRQNGGSGGQAKSAGVGNSSIDAAQSRKGNALTETEANEFRQKVAYERQLQAGIDEQKATINKNNLERSQLLHEMSFMKKPTGEQLAKQTRLERETSEARAVLNRMVDEHSKAVGDVESMSSGPEPTKDIGNYLFAKTPYDPQHGPGDGANRAVLNSWLGARVMAKMATPTEARLFGSLGGFKPGAGTQKAARAALSTLTPAQHDQMFKAADQLTKSLNLADSMGKIARVKEGEMARRYAEHVMSQDEYQQGLHAIDQNVENGTRTRAQADQDRTKLNADFAEKRADDITMKRGLAGFEDDRLMSAAGVANTLGVTRAHVLMNIISRTHNDPTMRAVAAMLDRAEPTSIIHVVENPDFDGARYRPVSNIIEVGNGGMNPITMMHETTHELTHAGISRAMGNEGRENLNARERSEVEALGTIRDVMQRFSKIADLTNPEHTMALESEHEFVAEALNNPDLQQVLGGRAGLFTRFIDGVKQMLGMKNNRAFSDFERLMQVTPTLFGNPNRASMEVFNRLQGRPAQAIQGMKNAFEQLRGVSPKIANADTLGERASGINWRAWTTLNNGELMLDRAIEGAKHLMPAELGNRIDRYHDMFRDAVNGRKADGQVLSYGKGELQEITQRGHSLLKEMPGPTKGVHELMAQEQRVKVDASAKTLAEAQRLNPGVTKEMFDQPQAVKNRATYDRLQRQFAGKNGDNPLKWRDDAREYQRLGLARSYAEKAHNIIHAWEMDRLPAMAKVAEALDMRQHTHDADHNARPIAEQGRRMHEALITAMREVDAHAKGNEQYEKASAAIHDLVKTYDQQRSRPYFHAGRTGSHFIRFEVAEGATPQESQDNWDRVGEAVKGLNRDWGDVVGGNREVYMRMDKLWHGDAEKALDPLEKAGLFNTKDDEGNVKSTWASGMISEHSRNQTGTSPGFIKALEARYNEKVATKEWTKEQADQAVQDLHDTWLQQMPESSPQKFSMQSDSTVGGSRDYLKQFTDRAETSNRALTNARASIPFADSLTGLRQSMRDLHGITGTEIGPHRDTIEGWVGELNARAKDLQTPIESNPYIAKARAYTAMWRLALSPAYMAMVSYQPWQITMPAIGSKYGFGRTSMAMGRNTGLAVGILKAAMSAGWNETKGYAPLDRLSRISDISIEIGKMQRKDGSALVNERQADLINHLMDSGLINFGMAAQIYRMDKSDISLGAKVTRAVQLPTHAIEMVNRITSALTAHEMATQGIEKLGKGDADRMHDDAKRYAMTTIRDTDGDHSQVNVARNLGQRGVLKQFTPLAVGFGQYDIQMTELIGRTVMTAMGKGASKEERIQAAKMLGGISVMTSGVAGALGLPMMGVITGLYNAAVQLLQNDGDTPPDFEKSFRDALNGIFGEKGGEIAARGLPRLAGIDMSNRSGYQDLAPMTSFLTDRQKMGDRFKDGAFNFMGPAFGALAGLATGAQAAYEGDYPTAINDALPAAVRNVAKAYRMAQYGYETKGANMQIPIPADSWEVAMQAAGFLSAPKAEQSEKQFAWTQNQKILENRHNVLMNEIMRASDHGDYEALGNAMQKSMQFAMSQPQFRGMDVAQAERSRMMQQAVASQTGGVMVGRSQLPYYQRFAGEGLPGMTQ